MDNPGNAPPAVMAIEELQFNNNLANLGRLFDVTLDVHTIRTTLTSSPQLVAAWLIHTLDLNRDHYPSLLVGLAIESSGNTNNRVDILQLCAGHSCLIFQISRAPYLPSSLVTFLSNPNISFVGIGIQDDVTALLNRYSLRVTNTVDLRIFGADVLRDNTMRHVNCRRLAQRVMDIDVEWPQSYIRREWHFDGDNLSLEQVQFVTVAAFLRYKIAYRLTWQ
ncbi:uncharacterized protein LOC130715717 [Lotus japonicus]|uniref:uncharacterized protein LOC130715717 n=1 Tax=Lotus japonicus TaxID=34305 RepID=UPI00258B666A|nr:uncharacterized protein LOC130715717 [Lotus japonicus]